MVDKNKQNDVSSESVHVYFVILKQIWQLLSESEARKRHSQPATHVWEKDQNLLQGSAKVDFFLQLNLLPPYSLCSQGDKNMGLCLFI